MTVSTRRLFTFTILIVCALHLWRIGIASYWFDELFTASSASEPTLSRAFERWYLKDLINPPWYMVLVFYVGRVLGTTEWALRLPSWLFVSAGCLFLGSRRLSGDARTGPLAGLLLAAMPLSFLYSQEARVYGLLMAASAIAIVGYIRFVRDGRVNGPLVIGAVIGSWSHFSGLFFAASLLLLVFVALLRQQRWASAVGTVCVGLACLAWPLYIFASGRLANFVTPTWIQFSWVTLGGVLMNTASPTIVLLVGVLMLRQPRWTSTELSRSVVIPALLFCALMATVSIYRNVILGRYFIVLAPVVAIMTADLILTAWTALERVSPVVRRALILVVALSFATENLLWMSRQKWGPYQNYRGVADYVVRDMTASGLHDATVALVVAEPVYTVETLEQFYFRRAGAGPARLRFRVVDASELQSTARDSRYIVAMHPADTVKKVRADIAADSHFEEVDIPVTYKSLTYLAIRR